MKFWLFCLLFLPVSVFAETYFPITRATEFELGSWYPTHLKAMREPSLYLRLAKPIEEFRFLYLPTFHHPVSIRLTRSGQKASLRVVMLSGKGGYAPGRILIECRRELSPEERRRFEVLLSRSRFWESPNGEEPGAMDGSVWLFEASGGYRYRLLERWTPTYDTRKRGLGRIVDLGRYLVSLSGLQFDKPLY